LADAALKVLWNRGLALRRIGIIESSVSLRGLILSEACPLHAAFDDQPPSALPVDRRPSAARSPRREALQEEVLTVAAKLPVDPPEADRLVDRFRLRAVHPSATYSRGAGTFRHISEYPWAERLAISRQEPIVELTVPALVPDVQRFTLDVTTR
jgi:hypothetical protein